MGRTWNNRWHTGATKRSSAVLKYKHLFQLPAFWLWFSGIAILNEHCHPSRAQWPHCLAFSGIQLICSALPLCPEGSPDVLYSTLHFREIAVPSLQKIPSPSKTGVLVMLVMACAWHLLTMRASRLVKRETWQERRPGEWVSIDQRRPAPFIVSMKSGCDVVTGFGLQIQIWRCFIALHSKLKLLQARPDRFPPLGGYLTGRRGLLLCSWYCILFHFARHVL